MIEHQTKLCGCGSVDRFSQRQHNRMIASTKTRNKCSGSTVFRSDWALSTRDKGRTESVQLLGKEMMPDDAMGVEVGCYI